MERTRRLAGLSIYLFALASLCCPSANARRQENIRLSGYVPTSVDTQLSSDGQNGLWFRHNAKNMALSASIVDSDKSVIIEAFEGQNFLPLVASQNKSGKPVIIELSSP